MSVYVISGLVLGVVMFIIVLSAKAKAPKQHPKVENTLHANVSSMVQDKFGPLGFSLDPSMKIYDDIHKVFARGEQRIRVLYDAREKRFELSYSPGNIMKEYKIYFKTGGVVQTGTDYHNHPDWHIVVEGNIGDELSESVAQEIYSECESKIEVIQNGKWFEAVQPPPAPL